MDDGSPTLEVAFAINAGSAFDVLDQLVRVMDTTEAKVVRDAANILRATQNMIRVGDGVAQIEALGPASSRTLQQVKKDFTQAENAAEGMIRQIERQTAAFGLTREQLRAVRAEERALAAERTGNTDAANRLRAAEAALYDKEFAAARAARIEAENAAEEKVAEAARAAAAAEAEAKAIREAAFAFQMFEARVRDGVKAQRELEAAQKLAEKDAAAARLKAEADAAARLAAEHERLAALVRGSAAAQEADAAAAERLRASTDPLYAATRRLNEEIAESTRLYHAGMTAAEEYARQQAVLQQRLKQAADAHDAYAGSVRKNGFALTNLSFQLNDVITMAASGAHPFQILATQGGQIFQVFQTAEGGAAGLAKQLGVIALRFAPVIAVVAAAGVAFAALHAVVSKGADDDMKKYAQSLGLSAKEIRHLKDVTITFGDTTKAVFQVAGSAIWSAIGSSVTGVWATMKDWLAWVGTGVKDAVNGLIGGFVGAYQVISKTWSTFPAVIGDAFFSGVNAAIAAINLLVEKSIDGINSLAAEANRVLPTALQIPKLGAPQIDQVKNSYAGAGAAAGKVFTDELQKSMKVDYVGNGIAAIRDQARKNAEARIRKQAEDKGYLDPKADKHAEALAREAAAVEAQIRNLYLLATAYGVSGAAALIADARVKAESQAIKQRADIEAAVDRQVRLSIAQRVADAAKGTAAMRDQADAQERVNAMVAAGLVPADRAAELVKAQIADLPLLEAAQAAQQRGLTVEAEKATKALADQQKERERVEASARAAQFLAAKRSGDDQLAALQEELRLVGATDAARVHALATLKAMQEAQKFNPEDRAAYIKQQVDIADAQHRIGVATNQLNQDLRLTSERADEVADAMSRAFGRVGSAIGDVISILGHYGEEQEKIAELVKSENLTVEQGAKRSADLQMNSLIGITGAAKNLFKEHSKGYQAMAAAEKALTILQLARTAVDVAGGAARMFAQLGPFAFPAVAAMLGVMASLGFGGGSGVSSEDYTKGNTGTGTVLGDSDAKSDSIKRAIDSLKEVDALTNTYAREMAASLRSIDSQIGNVASLVVRAGDINASAGVNTGFNTSTTGSVLKNLVTGGGLISSIPILGGIAGAIGSVISSLFGTKTTVVGSGLYGGAQSLGSILSGGFDASYYSDIQKKKKFLGITTSTKYSTQYAAADPTLENQFTLILRSFSDAIAAAAGPLGVATSDIQQRLNSFVVNIGKIDLKGLTGEEIQEKLTAVFGAAADQMANAAFPGIERFQKVGEGAFETLVRVASTVESVTNALGMLGSSVTGLSIDAKLGLADLFDSVGDLTSAVSDYFERFYTQEEQVAAQTDQLQRVFTSLGLVMPDSLASFRALVEAQNLNTEAGRATYATLLQLAPAFADLQQAMNGARSAADIMSERQDLQRKLLELQGDTAAIRALDLAKIDISNRALQEQIWAMQDAQDAAKAADDLRKAWTDVGTSIMDEVKRIRGLADPTGDGSFASLMGQFNAATAAARGGDQDAAKQLPGLSQALLQAAADAATSRQELERVQAQTAASLEATYAAISGLMSSTSGGTTTADALIAAMTASQGTAATSTANDNLMDEIAALRAEVAALRADNNAGHAATAGNTGRIAKTLDNVTQPNGGDAISVANAA